MHEKQSKAPRDRSQFKRNFKLAIIVRFADACDMMVPWFRLYFLRILLFLVAGRHFYLIIWDDGRKIESTAFLNFEISFNVNVLKSIFLQIRMRVFIVTVDGSIWFSFSVSQFAIQIFLSFFRKLCSNEFVLILL